MAILIWLPTLLVLGTWGEPPAEAAFVPPVIELGEHDWCTQVSFTAEFVNSERQPVTIADVKANCECTVIDSERYTGAVVEPGGTLSIPGTADVGRILRHSRQFVQLRLVDGREFKCEVHWSVRSTYSTAPESVEFYVLDDFDTPAQRVEFRSERFKLVSAPTTDSPWLKAERDGNSVVIRVDAAKVPTGRTIARVLLQTDEPDVPLLRVPVMTSKLAKVNALPGSVVIVGAGDRVVQITDAAGELMEDVDAMSDDARLRVELPFPGQVRIRVTEAAAPFSAVVRVRSQDGDVCEIPVYVAVNKGVEK